MTDKPVDRVRLRSGIQTINGITGETGPLYSEYVLAEHYDALRADVEHWKDECRKAKAERGWRCFSCDAVFVDGDAAEAHFGRPHGGKPMPECLAALRARVADYEEVLTDHRRLVRELDVLFNGEAGAAKQASLCDIVSQVRREGIRASASAGVGK